MKIVKAKIVKAKDVLKGDLTLDRMLKDYYNIDPSRVLPEFIDYLEENPAVLKSADLFATKLVDALNLSTEEFETALAFREEYVKTIKAV